jgi:NAD(P)-dependent dehydrogenase (short-subunit alcohol dehydrogenase family)
MAQRQAVLVTGAAKGIGHACVLRLVRAGFRVYASVRNQDDGAALVTVAGPEVTPVLLDITNSDAVAHAADLVARDLGTATLRGIVNNAGIAVAGPLEFLPIAEVRRQLEVNVIGQLAVTQAFLPLLRQSHGRIINIGSIAGRSAMPMTGPYSASKFALEAISDSLRVELIPAGVDVILIEPGMIATPIWQTSIKAADQLMTGLPPEVDRYYGRVIRAVRERASGGGVNGLPADRVAQVVEKALTTAHPRTRYVVGRDAKLRLVLQYLPDRIRDRIIARKLARM